MSTLATAPISVASIFAGSQFLRKICSNKQLCKVIEKGSNVNKSYINWSHETHVIKYGRSYQDISSPIYTRPSLSYYNKS